MKILKPFLLAKLRKHAFSKHRGFMLLVLFILVCEVVQAYGANAWLAGFKYRKPITIDNIGDTLTNYQVKISLDGTNFDFTHTKPDGSDIRFTDSDGISKLFYWIEKWDATNRKATIWVKVPLIQRGTQRIYMYYGNPNAQSESNGDNTFDFFDDFNRTGLDTSKWEVPYSNAGSYSVSNSNLYINLKTNTGLGKSITIRSTTSFPYSNIDSYIFEAKVKANAESNPASHWILSGMGIGKGNTSGNYWDYKFIVGWQGENDKYTLHSWVGSEPVRFKELTASNDEYYTYYLHIYSSNSAKGCIGSRCANAGWDIGSTTNYRLVLGGQGNAYVEYWFDWIRVRKYAKPEPTTSIGPVGKYSPINVEETRCKVNLTMSSAILFDFNKYNLKPEAKAVLQQVIDYLKPIQYEELIVEGYTDNVGSKIYNLQLSIKRAASVADYLMKKGLSPQIMEIVGYGESKPKYPNDTEEHRAKNRRVEIEVIKSCKHK